MTGAETTSPSEFDQMFDEGADMTPFIVKGSEEFPAQNDKARKININMPEWLIEELDREAQHLAVNRQAIINTWLAEKLEEKRRSA
ncbi:type II toxin-antitoxin system BrnA family antitoxin [Eggerthella sinensis]|uniref:type II toxin-antitoxin system BrnA family antitoxin n=1 Tax=Eggerthella sinensis TaxID=242230 RepID=UPI00266C438F|nr:CopG family transcriptional regulator [Eggerthella sinensis]